MTKTENNSFAYLKFKSLCDEHKMTPYQVSVKSNGAISTAVLTQWKNGEYDWNLRFLQDEIMSFVQQCVLKKHKKYGIL